MGGGGCGVRGAGVSFRLLFIGGLLVPLCGSVKVGMWSACVCAWHRVWLVVLWWGLWGLCVFLIMSDVLFCERSWWWVCDGLKSGVCVEVKVIFFL